jgi:ariadne-1
MDSDDDFNSAASVNSDADFDMDDENSSVADFGAGMCLTWIA